MFYEVGYNCGNYYSINMITAETEASACEAARRRAERKGYKVVYVTEKTEAEAAVNVRKGMPMYAASAS